MCVGEWLYFRLSSSDMSFWYSETSMDKASDSLRTTTAPTKESSNRLIENLDKRKYSSSVCLPCSVLHHVSLSGGTLSGHFITRTSQFLHSLLRTVSQAIVSHRAFRLGRADRTERFTYRPTEPVGRHRVSPTSTVCLVPLHLIATTNSGVLSSCAVC